VEPVGSKEERGEDIISQRGEKEEKKGPEHKSPSEAGKPPAPKNGGTGEGQWEKKGKRGDQNIAERGGGGYGNNPSTGEGCVSSGKIGKKRKKRGGESSRSGGT